MESADLDGPDHSGLDGLLAKKDQRAWTGGSIGVSVEAGL
jgi:hypothetical protein